MRDLYCEALLLLLAAALTLTFNGWRPLTAVPVVGWTTVPDLNPEEAG